MRRSSVLLNACFYKQVLITSGLGVMFGFYSNKSITQNSVETKGERPNVIFILTDDQGSVDVNCYGAKDLYTPNIDLLAQQGVRFTQFYVAAPVCSPSRASLLTGRNPHAAGLPGNASSHIGHPGMPTQQITIAEVLKEAGYATAHIGKWHLGYTPHTMPLGQGFDYSFGHMGGCIDNYSHFFYWNGANRHDLWENGKQVWADGEYFPDLMAQKVDEYLEQHQREPFFLYYAINMPHYPLQPTHKWRQYYKELPMPRRDYAAFVSTIDERIGRMLDKLRELGLSENTIVIYQSDHGHSTEDRTFGGGGNAGPFRGCKFSLFEGGIRIPSIISWPGHIPQNEVRSQMAVNVDWFPTILDMCHIKNNPSHVEGKSLLPMIQDANKTASHDVFWWKSGISWAVRMGDWKLLGSPQDASGKGVLDPNRDQLFLANMKIDSTEMVNLADKYPAMVEKLKKKYLSWEYAKEDDMPKQRITYTHKAIDKTISIVNNPHPKYEAMGVSSLLDGETGTRIFSDGYWMGFEEKSLVATIDMGQIDSIEAITIGLLQDAQSWIFFPENIEISWSVDGKKYCDPVQQQVTELVDVTGNSIRREQVKLHGVQARFLKVRVENVGKCPQWHPAAGQKAFLFVDEIVVG